MREEVKQIQRLLEEQVYIADAAIATALYLSMALGKPLLIEGPAGVGKTEIAKALASALNTRLIRLQCYEGLDATTALYEWNYPKQLLHLKLEESSSASETEKEAMIFARSMFDQLIDLHGDKAAWKLIDANADMIQQVRLDLPYPEDINTPEDFARLT